MENGMSLRNQKSRRLQWNLPQMLNSRDRDSSPRGFEQIIGSSPALERVLEQVQYVAPTDSTVLIEGETGTGKELIAHAIHNASSRRRAPFREAELRCHSVGSAGK
jgi:transcriptional regulator with GAF, ATPase, and Fis domain